MPFTQDPDDTRVLYPPATLPGISEGDWIRISIVNTAARRLRLVNLSQRLAAITSDVRGLEGGASATVRGNVSEFDPVAYKGHLLNDIVKEWSDTEPPSPDSLATLHPFVQDWIQEQYNVLSVRSEEEKKDSTSSSSPTSAPGEDLSPESSPTSPSSAG